MGINEPFYIEFFINNNVAIMKVSMNKYPGAIFVLGNNVSGNHGSLD